MKLLNAFSLNMVVEPQGSLLFKEIPLDEAQAILAQSFDSAVGHADTAAIFAQQLGMAVPAARATIAFHKGDRAVVGQYKGPRLPEGATTLPAGASIVWYLIEVA